MFVIHEPYTAKVPHLYSGCQAFQRLFSRAKANIFIRLRVCCGSPSRIVTCTFSVINVISFQLFLNAVACLENIGDKKDNSNGNYHVCAYLQGLVVKVTRNEIQVLNAGNRAKRNRYKK